MTKIKICGLTRIDDTIWANKLMPDYIGFIFTQSKRYICPEKAKKILDKLNPNIKTVGIFVNPTEQYIKEILSKCPIDIAQLHGEETPKFCTKLNLPVWKAFRMKSKATLEGIKSYDVDAILLDAYHETSYGGEGISFPWQWANDLDTYNKPLVLAGGLTIKNVEQAIKTLHPKVVDVSSSVETDGKKDSTKIKKFIRKVQQIDE